MTNADGACQVAPETRRISTAWHTGSSRGGESHLNSGISGGVDGNTMACKCRMWHKIEHSPPPKQKYHFTWSLVPLLCFACSSSWAVGGVVRWLCKLYGGQKYKGQRETTAVATSGQQDLEVTVSAVLQEPTIKLGTSDLLRALGLRFGFSFAEF